MVILEELEEEFEEFDPDLPQPPTHEHVIDTEEDLEAVRREFDLIAERALAEWGPGWPNCQYSQWVVVIGGGVRVNVRREIATLVKLLLDESVRRGYKIRQADTGAGVCRPIGGTQTASNHSWALAIDINWQTNGFGYNVPHDIPEWMFQLWEKYGFNCGARWQGKKDWMHFEWKRSKAAAADFTQRLINDLNKNPTEGFLMALSDQEQAEALQHLRNLSRLNPLVTQIGGTVGEINSRTASMQGELAAIRNNQIVYALDRDDANNTVWAVIDGIFKVWVKDGHGLNAMAHFYQTSIKPWSHDHIKALITIPGTELPPPFRPHEPPAPI